MDLSCLKPIFSAHNVNEELALAIYSALKENNDGGTLTETYQIAPIDLARTVISSTQTEAVDHAPTDALMPSRYDDLGLLGKGSMGEVRRILDRELNRILAMKIIHTSLLNVPMAVARFVEEGQVCAQLQHPNIVPIHEIGVLPDGRLFFTMQEIQGREFSNAIKKVHAAIKFQRWQPTSDGWNFRRLIDVFHQVCNAVAYAHSKGVIHRDLKPANIMLGSFGEVLVVDWGIAKVRGRRDINISGPGLEFVSTDRSAEGSHATKVGQIAGTPAYMAPEQATGQVDKIDERTDVYALGAILYEIMSGRSPFIGNSGKQVLQQLLSGPPVSLRNFNYTSNSSTYFEICEDAETQLFSGPQLPEDLLRTCEKAMARNPDERFQSVSELSEEIEAWLDGAKKREQALKVVEEALQTDSKAASLMRKAVQMRVEAQSKLEKIPRWESEEIKAPYWRMEDEAESLEQKVERLKIIKRQKLHGALTHKADLPEAHALLASQYRAEHVASETARHRNNIQQAELHLLEHASALPLDHVQRHNHFTYLKGIGALSIMTSEGTAEVLLEQYVVHNRRLIVKPLRSLGYAPIVSLPIKMGSYRLRIRKEGFHEVIYPIHIVRGVHWDGVHPLTMKKVPVWLPPKGFLDKDDCYVPAGWFWGGSTSEDRTAHSLPREKIWIDGFVMKRFPVTNREYLVFLNDLLKHDREEEALRYVPRERSGQASKPGAVIYSRNNQGDFVLVPDAEGDLWDLNWPVMMINWHCATAYASWRTQKAHQTWRLPEEYEWEKSARGVDGRIFPWGDGFDASRACMRDSHTGTVSPVSVNSYEQDESPYGVRGMAGSMKDWTNTEYRKEGPLLTEGFLDVATRSSNDAQYRTIRGGHWYEDASRLHVAHRNFNTLTHRYSTIGFRIAKSVP